MRHVNRSESPDSIDSVEPAPVARSRVRSRVFKLVLAAVLGGLAYSYADPMLALWSPLTVVTDTIRLALGGGVAVLVLALSVLLPAAAKARLARRGATPEATDTVAPVAVETEESSVVGETEATERSPEEMMISLESELSAAAAELAAELERAANAGVPEATEDAAELDPGEIHPGEIHPGELDIEREDDPPVPVIVAVDPPQAMAAIAIPVWVDDVPINESLADESLADESSGEAATADVEPVPELPVAETPIEESPVDESPDADGNTNPTVRVLQAQIRSLEEALFRQAAAESHSAEPQPELPRAATRDEVTREVLQRVRSTIRGLGVRMDSDPAAADVLARVEAAVDRLAETGFFIRPTLSEPDAEFTHAEFTHAEFTHGEPGVGVPGPAEAWGAVDDFVVSTEEQHESHDPEAATAGVDDRPLVERLAAEAAQEEPEIPEVRAEPDDVVLPVPAGPPPPATQRGRRWRRRTTAA